MIGNDVVDLVLARKESNWRRTGYLQKIFTESEQLLIKNSSNPHVLVWKLWSMKEAAYKIYNRQTGVRAFFPKELECTPTSEKDGVVSCRGNYYYTQTNLENDFLHSVAVIDRTNFDLIIFVDHTPNVIKVHGIPFLKCIKSGILQPVSISHHGQYYKAIALKS
jgi:phosphopantetheinyl transferase (holo-ACP synthase)